MSRKLYRRNKDDVSAIIKHAKLDESCLTELTQSLYFPDAASQQEVSNSIKLLELDKHLLGELTEGSTVEIKGGLHEKVVLCTRDRTYELKEAEISNCLILVPDLKFGQQTSQVPLKSSKNSNINRSLDKSTEDENGEGRDRQLEHLTVLKVFHEYLECRPIQPRFRKLYDLLQLTRYSGSENEHCIETKFLFTYKQLLDTTQCSEGEFLAGLRLMRAIPIGRHYRVLSIGYEHRVVSLMLDLIEENSWQLNEVDREITISSLNEIIPEEVLSGIFETFTEPVPGTDKYRYKEDLVCQTVARQILAQPGMKFYRDDFMTTWQQDLTHGITIKEEYLKGIGIVDHFAEPVSVISLNEFILPTTLHERIKMLFSVKSRWTVEEITPFLECFLSGQQAVATILMKFTRAMKTSNGERIYVEKYSK